MIRLRIVFFGIVFATFFLLSARVNTYAVYNPLIYPNNFIGIHILFPSELSSAAHLVNDHGNWGYVTIPIQAGDKDLVKWQLFMNECAQYHIIPIIRLATESYYKDTQYWRIPTEDDIVDFANFLNSLYWPTKNRYVILFNEVNRYDEWGGEPPNAVEYTQLVDFAVDAFKARDPDFYLILAGLDNGAPNDGIHYVDNFTYLQQMANFDSNIFNRIDGFASHSYPNPGFSAPPDAHDPMGVATYRYEYNFINTFTNVNKPAFITETGWNSSTLSQDKIAQYFTETLNTIWEPDRDKIVAITPFLLDGEGSGFDMFSFIQNGKVSKYYTALQSYPKVSGEPVLAPLPPSPTPTPTTKILGIETFQEGTVGVNPIAKFGKVLVRDLLGI